jgi:hypothetical protein
VTVAVTVTNAQGDQGKGTLSFTTVKLDLKMLDRVLRCRLSRFRNFILSIPEWEVIEEAGVREAQLKVLQEELVSASQAVQSVETVIQGMKLASAQRSSPAQVN